MSKFALINIGEWRQRMKKEGENGNASQVKEGHELLKEKTTCFHTCTEENGLLELESLEQAFFVKYYIHHIAWKKSDWILASSHETFIHKIFFYKNRETPTYETKVQWPMSPVNRGLMGHLKGFVEISNVALSFAQS